MNVTMFPVGDLEIDLPISELNAQQKVTSIKANGLIQPITVWLGGDKPRIIDGFHRLEAYRRIGRTEIPAITQDCTEEAFWDARIQSAKQHHEIERDRLLSWIAECWAASRLCKDNGNGWEAALHNLADTLWDTPSVIPFRIFGALPEELKLWIGSHAKQWGCTQDELIRGVLERFRRSRVRGWEIDAIAKKHDLSFDNRVALNEIDVRTNRRSPGYDVEEVDAFLQTNPLTITVAEFCQYADAARQRKEELEDQRSRNSHAEERGFCNSEVGKQTRIAALRKRLIKMHNQLSNEVYEAELLTSMPDGPELIAEFGKITQEILSTLWIDAQVRKWEIPSVLEELAKLRRELAKEHDLRIRAEAQLLEREKRSAKLQEKLEGVVAWPSGK